MEFPLQSSPGWLHTALASLASLLTGGIIVKLWNTWLNRKKPAAETDEIKVRSTSDASDSIMRMMDRLIQAQWDIDRLRRERDEWQLKAEQYKTEVNHEISQREKAMGILKAHRLSYSEFDAPPPDIE